jgi:hypothetical protein
VSTSRRVKAASAVPAHIEKVKVVLSGEIGGKVVKCAASP